MLVSGVQQNDSVLYIYIYVCMYTHTHMHIYVHTAIYILLQYSGLENSLDYTVQETQRVGDD